MKNILSFSKTQELNKIYLGMHLLEKVGKRVLPIEVRFKLIGMIGFGISKVTIVVLFLSIVFSTSLLSQTTFNKDITPMRFISRSGPVLVSGDTIICLGNGTDINPYHNYEFFIAKYDLKGNFLERKVDSIGFSHFQYINTAFIENGIVIAARDFVLRDSLGIVTFSGGHLLVIDIAEGEIIKEIKFSRPKEDFKNFITVHDIVKLDSITFAVVSSVSEEENANVNDSQISVINIVTEEVKYMQFGKKGINDNPHFLVWNGKKFLVGTYSSTPRYDIFNPYKKRVTRGHIYEIDTSGDWSEVFVSDTMRGGVYKMLYNEDGTYTCSSNIVKWYNIPHTRKYIWRTHQTLFKLDEGFNLLWERPWGLGLEYNWFSGVAKVLPAIDDDGYIVAGYQPNYPWDATEEQLADMKMQGINPMEVGMMQKFSVDGDSLWMRSYSLLSDTSYRMPDHQVRDFTYAPDGGYVLYGELDYDGVPGVDTVANYHAWLLKVDKDGCFVPGCGDTTDTSSVVNILEDIQVKIYPNPTSSSLFIYQSKAGMMNYTVTDISGRKLHQWSGDLPSHTYILDVSSYVPGVYILNVVTNEGKRGSQKFVVE